VRRVAGEKAQTQSRPQSQEPLVRIAHSCDIHYAEDRPNPPLGTQLVMTSKTLSAEAVVPASVAIQLAKDLAEETSYESSQPCLSYDCTNAKCKGWINTLKSLAEEFKDLQDKEPDYSVHIDPTDWYNSIINWALEYTKDNGDINSYAEIASRALAEVDDQVYEELLEAGYTPEQIFKAFSKHLDEGEILYQMCHLKDNYEEIKKFLEEQGYNCDEDEEE